MVYQTHEIHENWYPTNNNTFTVLVFPFECLDYLLAFQNSFWGRKQGFHQEGFVHSFFQFKSVSLLNVFRPLQAGVLSTSTWNNIDYEELRYKSYTATVFVGDGKFYKAETLTVTVQNQNEAPFFLQKYYSSYQYEGAVSIAVIY